jgi:uncharacterized protein (DUF2236 family)
MRPRLERSEIVTEFLDIMRRTPILPGPLRAAQGLFIRAAIELLPAWVREILGLDARQGLKPWEGRLVRAAGALAERMPLPGGPREQARTRLGLSPA